MGALDTANENYQDEFRVLEEEIYTLFGRFKVVIELECNLDFFRNNNDKHGRLESDRYYINALLHKL